MGWLFSFPWVVPQAPALRFGPQLGPGSSPGDALLQFVLENFSSPVCSPLEPNSELVSPTLVWIKLLPPTPLLDNLAVFSLLKFWIGSQSEIPIIRAFGAGLFSLTVANADIAKLIVTLGGISDGMVILISMGRPTGSGASLRPSARSGIVSW